VSAYEVDVRRHPYLGLYSGVVYRVEDASRVRVGSAPGFFTSRESVIAYAERVAATDRGDDIETVPLALGDES
jgi:hypothetical protein